MTINNTSPGVIRYGNGAALEFSFGFKIFEASELKVAVVSDLVLLPISSTEYTVTISEETEGGSILFSEAPADGEKLYLYRQTALTQAVDISSQSRYDPVVVARVWDKLTAIVQELNEKISRTPQTVPGEDPQELLNNLSESVATAIAAAESAATAQELAEDARDEAIEKENSMLRDRGAWANSILYSPSDIFTYDGRSYIVQASHISTTVSADLSASRIRIFADKGASGAGSGDMLNSDNLSGLTNKPLAFANIGGKAVGKVDLLPFSLLDPADISVNLTTDEAALEMIPVAKAVTDYVQAKTVPNVPIETLAWSTSQSVLTVTDLDEWDSIEIHAAYSSTGGVKPYIQLSEDNGDTWITGGYNGRLVDSEGSVGGAEGYATGFGLCRTIGNYTSKIFLDLLSGTLAEDTLKVRFDCVTYVERNRVSRGHGFVLRSSPEAAINAFKILHGVGTTSSGNLQVFGRRRAI